jgi:hypothetical protein
MRKLLVVVALTAGAVPAVAAAQPQSERPTQVPPCPGTTVCDTYANVENDVPLGCDVSPPQELWIDHIPGTLTFGAAHTWCADRGGLRVYSRWLQHANVCGDIDY